MAFRLRQGFQYGTRSRMQSVRAPSVKRTPFVSDFVTFSSSWVSKCLFCDVQKDTIGSITTIKLILMPESVRSTDVTLPATHRARNHAAGVGLGSIRAPDVSGNARFRWF